ncbi:MAG: lysophospholipid acyltransferase family protein [Vampirovibrionales bacterium]
MMTLTQASYPTDVERKRFGQPCPIESVELAWLTHPLCWLGNRTSMFVYKLGLLFKMAIRIQHPERLHHLPNQLIVVCNHQHIFDIPLVACCLPWQRPLAFMAKQELFESAFGRWYLQAMGSFAVNRGRLAKATIKSAKQVIEAPHWLLGLFPEGTREGGGDMSSMKQGAAFLVKATKAPVLPMVLTYHKEKDGLGRQCVTLTIGECLAWQQSDTVESFSESLQHTMQALLQKAPE